MSTANNRRPDPGTVSNEDAKRLALTIGYVVLAIAAVYGAIHLGHRLAGTGVDVPANPLEVLLGLAFQRLTWPAPAGWWVLGIEAALIVAVSILIAVAVHRRGRSRSRVDGAAAYMGHGRDIEDLSRKNVAAKAQRLGATSAASPGVPIGSTVATRQSLYGSWEDMHIDIWGPRTGKTTSRAVPAILEAPGSVLVTSNKRDVVDATRDIRAKAGPVWVFDPQEIVADPPSWWWNPLSYVTDEVRAGRLADHFAAATTGDRKDAHFEDNGRDLLACCLLAAAIDRRPLTAVYTWLTRPGDEEPADIVRKGGYPLTADQLAGIANAPDKERGSIYSTARRMAACLTYRHVAAWVTPPAGESRREFNPHEFVKSTGTLYSLSKEGVGSAGPLVMGLTAAVVEAAEDVAMRSSGGRLSTPLLGVLDEAANVCRWRELPSLYSHYGSRGIVLMTILQSWSQGVEVWGEGGMKKLWSASNVKVYGGGVDEDAFLDHLSGVIGDYDRLTSSTSSGQGQRTVSRQLHRERILDKADLAALPKGRAIVFASGSRPTMIRTVPWMTGPHAVAVEASIVAHDPQAERTILDAQNELASVQTTLEDKP